MSQRQKNILPLHTSPWASMDSLQTIHAFFFFLKTFSLKLWGSNTFPGWNDKQGQKCGWCIIFFLHRSMEAASHIHTCAMPSWSFHQHEALQYVEMSISRIPHGNCTSNFWHTEKNFFVCVLYTRPLLNINSHLTLSIGKGPKDLYCHGLNPCQIHVRLQQFGYSSNPEKSKSKSEVYLLGFPYLFWVDMDCGTL